MAAPINMDLQRIQENPNPPTQEGYPSVWLSNTINLEEQTQKLLEATIMQNLSWVLEALDALREVQTQAIK